MIGKVKKWLGIEGVKLELLVSNPFRPTAGLLAGTLRIQSKTAQRVTAIRFIMIERYSRGRGADRLIDEYQIGALMVPMDLGIIPGQVTDIPFTLSYQVNESNMDQLEHHLLLKGLARLAKLAHQVKSEFRLEAEATVEGAAMQPLAVIQLNTK